MSRSRRFQLAYHGFREDGREAVRVSPVVDLDSGDITLDVRRDSAAKILGAGGLQTHVIQVNKRDVPDASVIRFSTMHRAKGLEFDQVVVLAPAAFLGAPAETANERKLLYVAITRAKRAAALVMY